MRRFFLVAAGLILLAVASVGLFWPLRRGETDAPVTNVVPRPPALLEYRGLDSSELVSKGDTVEVAERDSTVTSASPAVPDPGASREKTTMAGFSVAVKQIVNPYRVLGIFVMPNETIEIETTFTLPGEVYTLAVEDGRARTLEPGKWRWTAPGESGVYPLLVEGPAQTMIFNVFVQTPFDNDRPILESYVIGSYEERSLRGDPRFNPPRGLIEVNEQTEEVLVSPHFTLGAFTCHQEGDPKFVALDEQLVLKLEMLLDEVNRSGIGATSFVVMSGYRTPYYNKAIGNTTRYSLHLFGRAADIFIDEDRDGRMDDLNRDGRIDKEDARILYELIDGMRSQSWYQPFLGGLGLYGPNGHRGPFVHVDSRGHEARW